MLTLWYCINQYRVFVLPISKPIYVAHFYCKIYINILIFYASGFSQASIYNSSTQMPHSLLYSRPISYSSVKCLNESHFKSLHVAGLTRLAISFVSVQTKPNAAHPRVNIWEHFRGKSPHPEPTEWSDGRGKCWLCRCIHHYYRYYDSTKADKHTD